LPNRVVAALLLVVGVVGPALAGCAAAAARTPEPPGATHSSIVVHPTQVEFLSLSGASSRFPTGPLAAGDRVLGSDDLLQGGSTVGHDYEVCTVTFDLHLLCDDMLSFTNKGDLHVTWEFQWPATSSRGPSTFDGVIDGGTSTYRNARGDFHAVALPDRDLEMTATITP
jgi:hypothetical protein